MILTVFNKNRTMIYILFVTAQPEEKRGVVLGVRGLING